MTGSVFIVKANPVKGREDEFNDWYDNIHLAEILAIPGIVSAQRYKLSRGVKRNEGSEFEYCAIYNIDGDPGTVMRELRNAAAGRMIISDSLDKHVDAFVFTELGPSADA